jgi:hypothetical protein
MGRPGRGSDHRTVDKGLIDGDLLVMFETCLRGSLRAGHRRSRSYGAFPLQASLRQPTFSTCRDTVKSFQELFLGNHKKPLDKMDVLLY